MPINSLLPPPQAAPMSGTPPSTGGGSGREHAGGLAKTSAALAKLSKLSTRSTGLGKKSVNALDKASIISIAKRSVINSNSTDAHTVVTIVDGSAEQDSEVPWHAVETAAEVVEELVSSTTQGLSQAEAARRLKDFGPNRLTPADKPGFFRRLWNQLNNILIYILLAAAIVEGALQSWAEFGLVMGVIVVNTAIGLIQEGKAEKAAEAIKSMLSSNAMVLREGRKETIPAEELVPGDIVLIKSGDKIPADLRLITSTNLQVQEAMLTGESVPSSKSVPAVPAAAPLGDRKCMCYSATNVVSGQAVAVVVATGDSAEIGHISKMVNTVENVKNNLLLQLEILGRWLAMLVAIIAVIAFCLAMFHAGNNFKTAFESAVAVAVSIIPEGLPAMVTIVLAIGTTVMAHNNAIIRQLPAVETLGSLTIICSDKTGTLTKNEMTAVNIQTATTLYTVSGVGYAPAGSITRTTVAAAAPAAAPSGQDAASAAAVTAATAAMAAKGPASAAAGGVQQQEELSEGELAALRVLLEGAVLCNDSHVNVEQDEATGRTVYKPLGAPTEVSLLTLGQKAGLQQEVLTKSKPRIGAIPFESEHKFMATMHTEPDGRRVMYVKGAPDRLMPLCKTQVVTGTAGGSERAAPLDAAFWQQAQAGLSSKGLRVLALCRAELPADFSVEGMTKADQLLSQPPFLSMVLMVAILDPPREEAVEAIKIAHKAGITVKMITGDHSLTALAIGRMLGIASNGIVFTGPELDRLSSDALRALVKECNVFARASPENKLKIVRALQESKQTVAMTGDGVNDAPALKAADVGVAMGITGTDVSKEASKMVLVDDNFASIVAAVKEGRRVWTNIRKILIFNMPVNLAQGTSVMYAFIIGFAQAPLTALQVLLVNLVTSTTLGLALAAEPAEPTVMEQPPRRPNKRLVGKLLLWRMFFVCHVIVCLVLGMFAWAQASGYTLGQSRAEAFNILVGSQVAYFVTCRFLKTSTFHPRVFRGNRMIYISVPITIGLMVFLTMTPGVNTFFAMQPMAGLQWLRVFVCMVILYAIVEVEKALVDPVLMPLITPVLHWCERHTPQFLSVDQPLSARLARVCGGKQLGRTDSHRYKVQARGTFRRRRRGGGAGSPDEEGSKKGSSGGGGGGTDGGAAGQLGQGQGEIEIAGGSGLGLNRGLSAVHERQHSMQPERVSSEH